jgi:kynureninase
MLELNRDEPLPAVLARRAKELDRADALASFRTRFCLPEGLIYLDGNSLGAMPASLPEAMRSAIEGEWATDLIVSWNKAGWWDLPLVLGDRIARIIGAPAGTVVVCDSTSINIFKLLAAARDLRPGRRVIVTEGRGFHTDLYIAEGIAAVFPEMERRLIDSPDDLPAAVDEDVAVALVSDVNYRTGERYDMRRLTRAIQARGALAMWDLCHSAGVLPLELADCAVDLAVGCTYKYLNGGPGAPAFLYVAERHQGASQPLTGWWGHAAPFAFEQSFRPAPGIRRFLTGTQPVLALRALEQGLDIAVAADRDQVRAKSLGLTAFFMECVEPVCREHGLTIVTPRQDDRRGSQVALAHPQGYAMVQALIARRVVGDFRAPDILRFGFAPLYLSYGDVLAAAEALRAVLANGEWRNPAFQKRAAVT